MGNKMKCRCHMHFIAAEFFMKQFNLYFMLNGIACWLVNVLKLSE